MTQSLRESTCTIGTDGFRVVWHGSRKVNEPIEGVKRRWGVHRGLLRKCVAKLWSTALSSILALFIILHGIDLNSPLLSSSPHIHPVPHSMRHFELGRHLFGSTIHPFTIQAPLFYVHWLSLTRTTLHLRVKFFILAAAPLDLNFHCHKWDNPHFYQQAIRNPALSFSSGSILNFFPLFSGLRCFQNVHCW